MVVPQSVADDDVQRLRGVLMSRETDALPSSEPALRTLRPGFDERNLRRCRESRRFRRRADLREFAAVEEHIRREEPGKMQRLAAEKIHGAHRLEKAWLVPPCRRVTIARQSVQ